MKNFNLKIYVVTLFILLSLFLMHIYGMSDNLYYKFWFYDIIMHILGGAGIAMSVYCTSLIFNIDCIKNKLWKIVILTFFAGLAWELFEVYFNIAGNTLWTTPYYLDTLKDLIDDVLGSVAVYLIIKNK